MLNWTVRPWVFLSSFTQSPEIPVKPGCVTLQGHTTISGSQEGEKSSGTSSPNEKFCSGLTLVNRLIPAQKQALKSKMYMLGNPISNKK